MRMWEKMSILRSSETENEKKGQNMNETLYKNNLEKMRLRTKEHRQYIPIEQQIIREQRRGK